MLFGTLPAEAGTRPPCANLETFTRQMWKPDAACVRQRQRASVCGQCAETLGSRDSGGEEQRGDTIRL